MKNCVIASCFLQSIFVVAVPAATAGLGPENVAVIVNAASESSKKIAAEYASLREIPASNLIELKDVPNSETTTVEEFREKLLKPVLEQLDQRGLREQIDCIAWSSDFPTAINVKADIGKTKTQRIFTPVGSINGLTFLYEAVLKKETSGYLSLVSNGYFRRTGNRSLDRLPQDVATECIAVLRKAAKDESWDDAVKTLRKVAEDYPTDVDTHWFLARCLVKLKKPDEAAAELETITELGVPIRMRVERDPVFATVLKAEPIQKALQAMDKQDVTLQPTVGFRATDRWHPATGERQTVRQDGSRFLLSTVLAVTRGRGMTVEEAIENLRRSAKADGTQPSGTFYFPVNGNVRSTCRDGEFAAAALKLRNLGHKAEVLSGVLPQEKNDVAGAMIGTASFDWKKSGSTILPGAICEHLTSYGGIMKAGAGQTPLTEFLRNGAAGASGTVTEPFAIPHKFPSPFIHVHYASGCSLAEAFYQSVFGPYQLLIVGDPLCQPWAKFPEVTLDGIESGQEVSGVVEFRAESQPAAKQFEIFIDGRRADVVKPEEPIRLDAKTLKAGAHELRVVAVAASPIETRGRKIITVTVPEPQ